PFVLAYDGPDPNRGVYDAPWIWTGAQATKVKGYNYSPGQIQSSAEPVLSKCFNNVRADIPQALVQTCITTPGPVVLNIPRGHVFYGAIFMPRSQVTIKGGGRIHGFVAARRIIQDTPGGDRTFVESQEIEMASLAAYKPPGAKNDYFDYTRNYIKDNYNLVYTEFVDWTDKKYLPH
ncbi:MAG: hypothetical protein IJU05_00175, partial [Schwartzia sp.]|nr:hypothetical protein [Schwartzia sp. (in: firmicutes)]